MTRNVSAPINILLKAQVLFLVSQDQGIDKILANMDAGAILEVRNFLEQELIYLSQLKDENPISSADVKSNYEPIPNYYYRQDCREPLESCFNETCLSADPDCFSQKMYGQIQALLRLLKRYLGVEMDDQVERVS